MAAQSSFSLFYNAIRETQADLHSSILMSRELEEFSNQQLSDILKNHFQTKISDFKWHYTVILVTYFFKNKQILSQIKDIQSFYPNYESTLQDKNKNMLEDAYTCDKLPLTINNFFKKGQELPNDFIDILTFSFIPSLFSQFTEEQGLMYFFNFINKLSPQFQPLLSRSLFVSPFVMKFVHKVFYYNLKPYYEGTLNILPVPLKSNQLDLLRNQILASIRSNIHLVSLSVSLFLKNFKDSEVRQKILKESFFDQFLNHPDVFTAIDFYVSENELTFQRVKTILAQLITPEFIQTFDQIIIENEDFSYLFLNQQYMNKYYKDFHNTIILSNFDQMVMSLIEGKISVKEFNEKFDQVSSYTLYNYFTPMTEAERAALYVSYSPYARSDPWELLREMLKQRPLIPHLDESDDDDEDKDMVNIVHDNLIDWSDPMKSLKGKLDYEIISHNISLDDGYRTNLEQMVTLHNETEIGLIAFNTIKADLLRISNEYNHSNLFLNLNLFSYFSRKEQPSNPPRNIQKVVQNLDNVLNDLVEFIKQSRVNYNSKDENNQGIYDLIFAQRFFRNITFNGYLSQHPEYNEHDFTVYNSLNRNFYAHMKAVLDSHSSGHTTEQILTSNLAAFDSISLELRNLFACNCNPITKYIQFTNIFKRVEWLCDVGDPDQFSNAMISFLVYTNPPHFISNLMYMKDFLIKLNKIVRSQFQKFSTSYMSILKGEKCISIDLDFEKQLSDKLPSKQESPPPPKKNIFLKLFQRK